MIVYIYYRRVPAEPREPAGKPAGMQGACDGLAKPAAHHVWE